MRSRKARVQDHRPALATAPAGHMLRRGWKRHKAEPEDPFGATSREGMSQLPSEPRVSRRSVRHRAVARQRFDDGSHVDFLNSNGSGFRKLPSLTQRDIHPTWFPNGRLVAFTGEPAGRGSKTAIFTVKVNGTGIRRLTAAGDDAAVSPNGRLIAFDRPGRDGHLDLWLMNGNGSHQRMFATNGSNPCFSPDGLHLVFASVKRSGTHAIERVDVTGANRATIARSGDLPVWSPNGQLVAYSSNAFGTQPDEAELFVIPASGGMRKRLAFDNPISEDDTSFGAPDWQPRAR